MKSRRQLSESGYLSGYYHSNVLTVVIKSLHLNFEFAIIYYGKIIFF